MESGQGAQPRDQELRANPCHGILQPCTHRVDELVIDPKMLRQKVLQERRTHQLLDGLQEDHHGGKVHQSSVVVWGLCYPHMGQACLSNVNISQNDTYWVMSPVS
jgi:hypothetical protein